MPSEIGGMPFWTFLMITIIGGFIVIFVILYIVLWVLARNYRNKHNLHGDRNDYEDVVKNESIDISKEEINEKQKQESPNLNS